MADMLLQDEVVTILFLLLLWEPGSSGWAAYHLYVHLKSSGSLSNWCKASNSINDLFCLSIKCMIFLQKKSKNQNVQAVENRIRSTLFINGSFLTNEEAYLQSQNYRSNASEQKERLQALPIAKQIRHSRILLSTGFQTLCFQTFLIHQNGAPLLSKS